MKMIRDQVSFVILTWNSQSHIQDCLSALFHSMETSPYTFEVHIVDNGSSDRTPDIIRSVEEARPDWVFPIFLDQNRGTTHPRNLGLARCKGEYVCIMDSDVMIRPGTIDRLVRTLTSNPQIGLAVPRLIFPDGRHQKSVDIFPTLPRKIQRYVNLRKIEEKEGREMHTAQSCEVEYAISALWLFRQSLVREIGGLDEKIFYAPEDADFCLRIWKAGKRVVYDSRALAVHHTQELSRGKKLTPMIIHHIKGLIYYFLKHRYLFFRPRF